MDFGQRLKEILDSKGLNQGDLGRMAGIEEGYISKIINGKHKPSQKTVAKIAESLGIPLASLYDDEIAIKELVEEAMLMMPEDIIKFIMAQKNSPWIYLAKDLSHGFASPYIYHAPATNIYPCKFVAKYGLIKYNKKTHI